MPAPSDSPRSELIFRLPHRALRIAGMAFGVGLLLFVLAWWLGRDKGFYTPEPTAQASNQLPEALPEPMPAGRGASGMEKPTGKPVEERPQLVETAPSPAPVSIDRTTPAVAPAGNTPTSIRLAPGALAVPVAGQTPAPRYPAAAMRRGDSGTVLLQVEVGADGIPTDVSVAKRSGSRDLDRAAMDAVRQWRFHPGQQNGQAIASQVTLPVDFSLE